MRCVCVIRLRVNLQYLSAWNNYRFAIDHIVLMPQYRMKAQQIAKSEGLLDNKKKKDKTKTKVKGCTLFQFDNVLGFGTAAAGVTTTVPVCSITSYHINSMSIFLLYEARLKSFSTYWHYTGQIIIINIILNFLKLLKCCGK